MIVLLAEDEVAMSEAVVDILTYHNYTVDAVYDGKDALDYASCRQYDAIILDIMMPKLDGLTVLSQLRKMGNSTPVLLLTAKAEVEDRIKGLDTGADDYLPKPFAMGELLARLRAMFRRKENYTPDVLSVGNILLDQQHITLASDSGSMPLSKLEFQLMQLFMANPRMPFSADTLLDRIWSIDSNAETGTVWVYVSYLRKKLAILHANVEIRSKRGLGYSLEVLD